MAEGVGKEILFEGVDPRELYGPQNVYLEQLRTKCPELKLIARGSSLKVLGSAEEVARFEKQLRGLVAYYEKYGHLSSQVIDQCFAEGFSVSEKPVDKDVLVYGNNGMIIRARTKNQQKLVDLYEKNDLLFAVGPAGSGKTYTAIALAVRALKEKEVRRIILTRPAVEAGEKLGFLPGDLSQKVDPYLRPLYDAMFEMLGAETCQRMQERGVIEVAPLAYMRGRTLSDAFIILDEAQNTTTEQMKMFLTRMGFRSKIVVTGDTSQIDLPRGKKSGLIEAVEVLENVPDIAVQRLTHQDVVRHELVQAIVRAYDAHAARAKEERFYGRTGEDEV